MGIGREFCNEEYINNNNIFNTENIEFAIDHIGELFQKCRAYKTAEKAEELALQQIKKINREIEIEGSIAALKGKSDISEISKLIYVTRINTMKNITGIVEFKGRPMKECQLSKYVINNRIRNIINKIDDQIQNSRFKLSKKLNHYIQELKDEIKKSDSKYNSILNRTKNACGCIISNIVEGWLENIPEKTSEDLYQIKEDEKIHIENYQNFKTELIRLKKGWVN